MQTKYDIGDKVNVIGVVTQIHVHDKNKIKYNIETMTGGAECPSIITISEKLLSEMNKERRSPNVSI